MLATSQEANCTQLVSLARITHKYQFRSIENWALSALTTFYSLPGMFDAIPSVNPPALPHPTHGTQTTDTTTPSLVQITELAALCEKTELLNAAITRWKRQIGEGKDLALAMHIGERFNLRSMLGLAYHAMMLKGKAHWDSEVTLTRDHKIRLLCGYYNLNKLWESLPSQPPALTHSARCTSQQRCTKTWTTLWKTVLESSVAVIATLQKEDLLGRIMLAESMMKAMVGGDIPSQGFLDGMPHCKESALYATTMKVREIKDSLADYFSDDF